MNAVIKVLIFKVVLYLNEISVYIIVPLHNKKSRSIYSSVLKRETGSNKYDIIKSEINQDDLTPVSVPFLQFLCD